MCERGDTVETYISDGVGYGKTVKLDKCIVPLIKALNRWGIETRSSCCGHGKWAGWINLVDGRTLVLYDGSKKPWCASVNIDVSEALGYKFEEVIDVQMSSGGGMVLTDRKTGGTIHLRDGDTLHVTRRDSK